MSTSAYAEDGYEQTADSFYEIGQFKRTVARIDNGHKQCDELMSFLRDRAAIEEQYCKMIKTWGTKYTKIIEKGSCYHTLQHAWLGIIRESEKIADMHHEMGQEIIKDDVEKVKGWKKNHYHSLTLGGLKESKVCSDEFTKAQKQWAKLYKKVTESKKNYYTACKEERSAQTQENTAKSDSSLPPEKVKKLQEMVEKKGNERQKQKDKYENALSELDNNNARYMEDMEQVFTKCQDFEHERLTFFKEVLLAAESHLNVSAKPNLNEMYGQIRKAINQSNVENDLNWWRNNHGPGMQMNWPLFEEYDAERLHMQRVNRKQNNKASKYVAGGVDGISAAQFTQNTEYASSYPENNGESDHRPASWSDDDQSNPFDNDVMNDAEGVPVVALYDYVGAEADELSFSAGDHLTKLEDEDEQGWCKGKTADGTIGLYPANYMKDL